jgi:hypothetical protein
LNVLLPHFLCTTGNVAVLRRVRPSQVVHAVVVAGIRTLVRLLDLARQVDPSAPLDPVKLHVERANVMGPGEDFGVEADDQP